MEHFPVEVIGNILSHLRTARDVVVASATCKKWRVAFLYHLHSLTFLDNEFWPIYCCDLSIDRIQSIITQTILQTKGLQCLSIFLINFHYEFSADHVLTWLMHTRGTLRELNLYVRIYPSINILERCHWKRLEELELGHISISRGVGSYQKFPCLTTLRLEDVTVSALELRILLSLCPNIENLTLVDLDLDSKATVELSSVSLKTIDFLEVYFDEFILNADSLENLHLQMCEFELFKVVGKGTLKVLNINDVRIRDFDIGDKMENLEIVDVKDFTIKGSKLYHMISRSSNLRRLRLWHVNFINVHEAIDLERISASFPHLTNLSLYYGVEETPLSSQGSSHLQNVAVLELGCASYHGFSDWIARVMERCPNLKKIAIHRFDCNKKLHEDLWLLVGFSSSMVQLARKYLQVEFQFNYE